MTLDASAGASQIIGPTLEVPDDILDGLAIEAALRHLGPQGLDALRIAAEGHDLNDAQRGLLRNGWNGALILAGDRLTRLGEQAYSTASKKLPVPERQSPQIEDQEREAQARQHQWRQQQLQSRNIAQREEARDQAETLARKIDALKEQEITIKASDAPEPVKQKIIEQMREQERDILREAPREVRARMPKRDRGMDR